MSVKMKISYNTEEELVGIIRLLSPILKTCKTKPQKGRYKLAYLELSNHERTPNEQRESQMKLEKMLN